MTPGDGLCPLCGKHTDSLAGDPGQWSLRFCPPDANGVIRPHHVSCVSRAVYGAMNDLLPRATQFRFGAYSPLKDFYVEQRRQRDGSVLWAITGDGCVLNTEGTWEYEPSPSSRDDDFLVRTRFDIATAVKMALDLESTA